MYEIRRLLSKERRWSKGVETVKSVHQCRYGSSGYSLLLAGECDKKKKVRFGLYLWSTQPIIRYSELVGSRPLRCRYLYRRDSEVGEGWARPTSPCPKDSTSTFTCLRSARHKMGFKLISIIFLIVDLAMTIKWCATIGNESVLRRKTMWSCPNSIHT
jgi:hypothetical protein